MLKARTILLKEGTKAVTELRKITPKATGKTRRGIRAKVTKQGGEYKLDIEVPDQFPFTTEFGRGAGNFPPIDKIAEWVEAKGLEVKPYVIARTIANKGTMLYQRGGNKKAVDKIFKDMADRITSQLADLQVQTVLKEIDQWQ